MVNLANTLTGIRLFGTPVLVYFYLQHDYQIAFWLMLFLGITDWFDGFFARRLNQESTFGKIFDPIADKVLMITMFVTLGYLHAMPIEFITVCLARDILIILGGFSMVGANNFNNISPTKVSKINTFLQIICILFTTYRLHKGSVNVALQQIEMATMWVTSLFTITSGMQYAKTFWIFLKSR